MGIRTKATFLDAARDRRNNGNDGDSFIFIFIPFFLICERRIVGAWQTDALLQGYGEGAEYFTSESALTKCLQKPQRTPLTIT